MGFNRCALRARFMFYRRLQHLAGGAGIRQIVAKRHRSKVSCLTSDRLTSRPRMSHSAASYYLSCEYLFSNIVLRLCAVRYALCALTGVPFGHDLCCNRRLRRLAGKAGIRQIVAKRHRSKVSCLTSDRLTSRPRMSHSAEHTYALCTMHYYLL